MAVLNKEYIKFNKAIKLMEARKKSLMKSRKELRKKIRTWFLENKPNELQPKFHSQGSIEMNTTVNPIPEKDEDDNTILKYDLDDGVYFIEKENEDNKRGIETWHDWVYQSVENHTSKTPIRKTTCIRVPFADGHHIDLPIYYKDGEVPELAHKVKRWLESDPKEFYEWFNEKAKGKLQLVRIVRYLKAWKNFREVTNSNLKFPSGFALTILATNNYVSKDNDDDALRETLIKVKSKLDIKFQCLRPTTPKNEDVFEDFPKTRKEDFLTNLDNLICACKKANAEKNFKKASEYLRKEFGKRFPLGKDEDEESKNQRLGSSLSGALITPKPFAKS